MFSRNTRFAVRTLSGISARAPEQIETQSAIVQRAIATRRIGVSSWSQAVGGDSGSRLDAHSAQLRRSERIEPLVAREVHVAHADTLPPADAEAHRRERNTNGSQGAEPE